MDGDEPFDQLPTAVQQQSAPLTPDGKRFTLIVSAGPNKDARFVIDLAKPTRTLIGQSEACDLRLTDREVSRRHAALERVGNRLRLTDLDSTNGTFVDQVHVLVADLHGGEVLSLGSTQIRVEASLSSEQPPALGATHFGRILGESGEMRRIYPLCERLAASDVPVIVEGETGTGKEVLAESLHEESARRQAPFIVLDCTAIPASLLESELFGHERGAFTGAVATRKGVFEQAHGGTLLIDEIGDLDATLQPKLLRAIERSTIRRVGGDQWIEVDVRIVAATRRNLDREVEMGRFRDDLFHRLAIARIELPPLRHRLGDVSLLARHFWLESGADVAALRADLVKSWEDYDWPGNVRELRNTVARYVALGDLANQVRAPQAARSVDESLDTIDRIVASGLPYPQARDRVVDEFRERFVARLLELSDGDVVRAAAASGIGRRYFEKLRAKSSR